MAEEIKNKVDTLVNNSAPVQEVFDILTEGVKQFPSDPELLWRYARAHFDMADTKPNDKNWRKDYITKGLEYATKALEVDPNNYATHKWFAIMTSAIGDFLGTTEKIQSAFKIKEHALKADELKPKDPTTLHLLGRWCFGVANISWLERKMASTLFATPPESSYDEALKYFLAAFEADPTFRRNLVFTADTYVALKNNAKGKEFYQKAIDLPEKTEFDKALNVEAKQKLSKL